MQVIREEPSRERDLKVQTLKGRSMLRVFENVLEGQLQHSEQGGVLGNVAGRRWGQLDVLKTIFRIANEFQSKNV